MDVLSKWLNRATPFTEMDVKVFSALKQQLSAFKEWLESSIDTDDEDNSKD